MPPVISLQARGNDATPWEGHLATGLLVDTNIVMIPAPPGPLLEPGADFEVVLIPESLGGEGFVERIRPTRIDVFRVQAAVDAPLVAFVKLTQPSQYPPLTGRLDGCTLINALRAHDGDVWTTLESLGAISAEVRQGPSEAILRQLPRIEHEQRVRLWRDHVFDLNDPVAWNICWIVPWCDPCNPLPLP
jgi:hypothetical protein